MARVCHGCTDRSPRAQVGAPWHARSQAGPARARGECSERRCMPSLRHASPRRPRRGAQRRARRRRDREAPWHAPERGRSRAAAARLRRDGGKHGADRPRRGSGLSRHFVWPPPRHAYRTGTGAETVHGLPNSVPVFSDRWYCNEKSVMTAYTPRLFGGIRRPVSRRPSLALSDGSPRGLSDRRARRRRRYVDVPGPIGTGPPTSACTSSAGPSASFPGLEP